MGGVYLCNNNVTVIKSDVFSLSWIHMINDKVYGYYSMWNVRNNINQRNIESTQKLTEYVY